MPVYRSGSWLSPKDRPAWCGITAAGRFSVPVDDGRFDRHYHDDHELWFISAGKARIRIADTEWYLRSGDIVLTRAGDVHDFVAVYESVSGFFCETGVPAGHRTGHLYADRADAGGHDVPALPLPADFPTE